jgi:hypothetical protein
MIMHPVDCVKILQQSDAGYGLSLAEATAALWDRDGISGFYSGFVTYAVSDAAGGALKFAVWELWKQRQPLATRSTVIASAESRESVVIPPSSSNLSVSRWFQWGYWFVGAALAFVASSFVIVPGEFVKNQLQMDYYDGLWDAVTGTASTRGLQGFFLGYDGIMYRDVPYTMLELGLYEVFRTTLLRRSASPTEHSKNPPSAWDDLLAAALTGGITAFLTTPLDAVKTKLMVDAEYAGYSFADCFAATVEAHGIGSVFAGVVARVVWILPFTTIYLPMYDFLKRWMWRRYAETKVTTAG